MYRFSIYLKKGAENPRGSNSNQPSHEILKHRRYAPGNSPQILHYETKSTIKSPSKKHAIFSTWELLESENQLNNAKIS